MKNKSLTIHDLDPQMETLIHARAKAEGLSLNKTIKKVLEEALGIKPRQNQLRLAEFSEFCGVWSEAELKSFQASVADLERAHPGDWK